MHLRHPMFGLLRSAIGIQSHPKRVPESVTPSAAFALSCILRLAYLFVFTHYTTCFDKMQEVCQKISIKNSKNDTRKMLAFVGGLCYNDGNVFLGVFWMGQAVGLAKKRHDVNMTEGSIAMSGIPERCNIRSAVV